MTTTAANYGWFYPIETGFGWVVEDRRDGTIHRNPILGDLGREQAEALAYSLYVRELESR